MLSIVSHAGKRVYSFLKLVPTSVIPVLRQWLENMLHSKSQHNRQSLREDISNTGIIVEISVHKSQKPGSGPASHSEVCAEVVAACLVM